MNERERWTVKFQDTADGSGDVFVELSPELLAGFGLAIGDELAIEVVNGAIVLRPTRGNSVQPCPIN
jgi:antitoxin ChpS